MPHDSILRQYPSLRRFNPDDIALSAGSGGHKRPPRRLRITKASSVEPKSVQWLWRDRLALGKLCVIAGVPNLGKSQLTIQMAAVVSTGRDWPDGAPSKPGDVLMISAEDSLDDTIRPRLDAAGADANRVHVLSGVEQGGLLSGFVLTPQDVALLDKELTERPEVRLVVIDPITAYLGALDSHKVGDVRGALQPLADLAEKHRVAVIAVTHLNKGNGTDPMSRVIGSGAFIAAPRTAFLVIEDRAEPDRRLFLELKNNIGRAAGLAFRIESVTLPNGIETSRAVFYPDTVPTTASEAMEGAGSGPNAIEEACDFLRAELADGPRPVRKVEAEAESAGIHKRTLERAKRKLGIISQKTAANGGWTWRLPPGTATGLAPEPDREIP